MTAADGKGNQMSWVILCASANMLRRVGVTPESLAPGTRLTIDAYRDKDRTNWLDGMSVTFKDGRKLPLYAPMAPEAGSPR
jgi:hypothetical protein